MVLIGQIVGSFGLRGQVKISPNTDFWSRFEKGRTVWVKEIPYLIEKSAIHKERPLLKLKGIGSIEAAEALKWEQVYATGTPELDPDEFLVSDLVGLEVVTDEGLALGPIADVLAYPAHDILVIGEVLIPLIKEFVKEVDLDSKKVVVHVIPGMVSD